MKRIYTYMCLLLLSVLSFAVTGCDDDDDDDDDDEEEDYLKVEEVYPQA